MPRIAKIHRLTALAVKKYAASDPKTHDLRAR
jgi:hypothetical protein